MTTTAQCKGYADIRNRPPYPLGSEELRQHVRSMVEWSQLPPLVRARHETFRTFVHDGWYLQP